MYLNIYSKMHFCMEVLVILNARRVFLKNIYISIYINLFGTLHSVTTRVVYTVLKKINYLRKLTLVKKW